MRIWYDIETSPAICYTWKMYDATISPDMLIQEQRIICICWLVEGEKRVRSVSWDPKTQCDKSALETFLKALEGCSELIGHNSKRFDTKWVRGRCLKHGLVMPLVSETDTLTEAKRLFNMPFKKLAYLAEYLDVHLKKDSGGWSTWEGCMRGEEKALRRMVKYCKGDVISLRDIYMKMLPYMNTGAHKAVADGRSRCDCPKCGSEDVKYYRRIALASGNIRYQMNCNGCGGFHRVPERVFNEWKEREFG